MIGANNLLRKNKTYATVGFVRSETLSLDNLQQDEKAGVRAERVIPAKPKLRGLLHLINTPVVLICGLVLLILADDMAVRAGCAVWTLTGIALFGNSALYHRGKWTEKVEAILRRIDHSNIAIFIAGTYTPLTIALLGGASRVILLSVIWGCAVCEVLFRSLWLSAPRVLYVALYLVMGWVALLWLPQFLSQGGAAVLVLIILGGVFYSLGAIVYAMKKPNPSPTWFGFHEIFHTGTILGATLHWVAILLAVL